MEDILNVTQNILQTTPLRWTALMTSFPVETLNRQPAPGEWSAVECLYHMIDAEKLFGVRLPAFLAGQDLPGSPHDPREPQNDAAALAALAARFAGLRAANLAALAQISAADLSRQVRHAKLGPVTLLEMLNETVAHDLCHLMQAEKALFQPFVAEAGPWKVFFSDLIVAV
jgi:uncharacterized damage-inducible protein DinB